MLGRMEEMKYYFHLLLSALGAASILSSVVMGGTIKFENALEAAYGQDANYTTVAQEAQTFLESLIGAPPIYTLSPEEVRSTLSGLQADYLVTIPPADVENRTIPIGENGEELSLQIIRPQGTNETLPVVMFFHGAGWVAGGFDTHERLMKQLANEANAAIVYVNYTLSPEATYPASIEQAYSATEWVAQNGQSINVDTSRLAVAGDSVGGNMATVVAMLAKERGGPEIVFQLLLYPVTDGTNFNTTSYLEYAEGYWLTRAGMMWFWDNYTPDNVTREQPTASPLRASIDQLRGLPPALVITDENDVLRDEGEAYAHKLMQANVTVTAIRYLGTIHDFMMLNALSDTTAARAAITQAAHALEEAFEER
jgi:acetyl esterase